MKTKTYDFKPMQRLTFWAQLLMGVQMAGFALGSAGVIISMVSPQIDSAILLMGALGAMVGFVILLVSGVVNLIWIYGACCNAHALRPGTDMTTPGWAVGWFFVPIACLFKPYQALRDIWIASHGPVNGKYPRGSSRVILWWWTFLIGNLLSRSLQEPSDGLVYEASINNWAGAAGLAIYTLGTACFFMMVREIHANQQKRRATAADVF